MKQLLFTFLFIPSILGGIIVPAYFPWWTNQGQEDFSRLVDYSHETDPDNLVVIINPSNGPATAEWGYVDDVRSFCSELKTYFQHPLAYVYTEFGNRPIDEVKEDMDNYIKIYGQMIFSGFFIDQASEDSGYDAYYEELINYTNELFSSCGNNFGAVLNGRATEESGAYSIVQTTEENFLGQLISSDQNVLITSCTNYEDVQDRVEEFDVDYYYCTDRSWSELPTFWDDMIDNA